MDRINDGGAVFPGGVNSVYTNLDEGEPTQAGMTLRDYFAAKCVAAMVGTIHCDADYDRFRDISSSFGIASIGDWFAREAYKQADAMLKAREVKS